MKLSSPADGAGIAAPRRARSRLVLGAAITLVLTLSGWLPVAAQSESPAAADVTATAAPSASPEASLAPERPEWFDLEMIDVQTGAPFTINDYAGKVVLLETMAVWCPTCRKQGDEMARLHELLGDPDDLVSISLDVDMSEDPGLLRDYAQKLGYDWHIAVAPLMVARALGNLYSAQYLNPPLAPMLVIDRDGQVQGLPFGGVKSAESLQGVVEPLLGD